MGTALIIAKVMPESPSTDLNELKEKIKSSLESEGAQNITFEEKDIAFGLKAVLVKLSIDESKGSDIVEQTLSKIEHVSSATIEDYRRAFG